ncbi:MAG: methionine adenosyltransferase [Candidatus Thermoplasmatota archaeon]|nr:methionine adenosyltransferase [Candidatus Thermoplasmatota archaeon]
MPRKRHYMFTSESVTEGHPDKMADQISDAILDEMLRDDPNSRVACETFLTTGMALVAGEITTNTYVDVPEVIKETIREIGYDDPSFGFDHKSIAVLTAIHPQSPDISRGVDRDPAHRMEQGAGDQGLMFGYASDETPELMPMPISLAHRITMRLAEVRKKKILSYLGPDGKSQVTVNYLGGSPVDVSAVVVASQHLEEIDHDTIKKDILEKVVREAIPESMLTEKTAYHVNETGKFVLGGPAADTGLTGRKIIVDTYGGVGSHGGGAFSGKDPSKVDRSGSYFARYIAKNLVKAGIARKAEVQISYAIGVAKPISLMVDTFGSNRIPEEEIEKLVLKHFDMRPAAMIDHLDLLRPIYKKTAAYGHFGRELPEFTWERTDMASELRDAAGL